MKKSKIALAILAFSLPAATSMAAENTGDHSHKSSEQTNASITVIATVPPDKVATETFSSEQLKRIGANDFGSIMRYQPLISAPFSSAGSGNGKSSFDRGGYTGYNIRGLDANRVSMDIEGIPLPDATGRSYDPAAGENTFGIGRDYIDPYLYGLVSISPGAAEKNSVNNVVGGSVSFTPKSPDHYLLGDKKHYFSYTSNFDTTDHSWHNGITSAFGNNTTQLLLAYSRRDGQQTRNNSDILSTYPMRWNSDAFIINGIYNPNENNRLSAVLDFYHKSSGGTYTLLDRAGHGTSDKIIGASTQQNISQRYSALIKHEFMPENSVLIDKLESKIFYQQTHVNDNTIDNQVIPALEKTWTMSDLNTKSYGVNSEISKQYGIHSLNYGVNFSSALTRRPFKQVIDPVRTYIDYSTLQPQGDSDVYDINVWIGDTIILDKFYIVPALKYSWHKITPKGFVDPDPNALGMISRSDLDQVTNTGFIDSQLLPSLTLMYNAGDNLNTYFKYKRGVSYPNTSQMYGVWFHPSLSKLGYKASSALIGNPDLKTEASNQFELGLVGETVVGVTVRGSIFYNSYRNFIGTQIYDLREGKTGRVLNPEMAARFPENISSIYLTENRDKAYIYGAELSSNIYYGRFLNGLDGLSSTLAVGYNQGRSKSDVSGDNWIDIDSVLPVKAVVSLAWDDPQQRYGASITASFVQGKRAEDSYRQRYRASKGPLDKQAEAGRKTYMHIPGYGVIDFSAYYNVNQNFSINAGVYNITNRKYWNYASNKTLLDISVPSNFKSRANPAGLPARGAINDMALGTAPGRTWQIGITAIF